MCLKQGLVSGIEERRTPGQLYTKTEEGNIQNLYNVLLVNKTFEPVAVEIRLRDLPDAELVVAGGVNLEIAANSTRELTVFVTLPPEQVDGAKTEIVFEVVRDGEVIETSKTNFLGPFSF